MTSKIPKILDYSGKHPSVSITTWGDYEVTIDNVYLHGAVCSCCGSSYGDDLPDLEYGIAIHDAYTKLRGCSIPTYTAPGIVVSTIRTKNGEITVAVASKHDGRVDPEDEENDDDDWANWAN